MVKTAEADIIGPAVAAKDPLRPFDQKVFVLVNVIEQRVIAFDLFQSGNQLVSPLTRAVAAVLLCKPLAASFLEFLS